MMAKTDAAAIYQQVASHGRSPVGLIVALYETILRDFARALKALEAGNVEARVFEMNHALKVIGLLQESLNHARGAEAAKRFQQLYDISRAMIVSANAKADRQSINELMEMYAPVREAWQQAERKLPGEAAPVENPAQAAKTRPETPPVQASRVVSRSAVVRKPQQNGQAKTSRPSASTPGVEMEKPRGRWSA
jgi:flagellar secretion chaperone FliS